MLLETGLRLRTFQVFNVLEGSWILVPESDDLDGFLEDMNETLGLEGENRFAMLDRANPEKAKMLHEELQKEVEKRHAERVRMAMSDKQLYKELKKTYGKK